MRTLLSLSIFLIGATAFASHLDNFVGEYVLKGGNSRAKAEIKKVLIPRDDLFEKDRYIYQIDLDGEHGGVSLYEELEISEDGKSLFVNTSNECDDPSCYYMTSLIATAKISRKGNPYIVVEFEGFLTAEGDDEGYDFSGEEVYFKKK